MDNKKFLIIGFIFQEEYFTDILITITAVCGEKVYVGDGIGAENFLANKIPVFAGLSGSFHGNKFAKIIYTITEDPNSLKDIDNALKQNEINLAENEEIGFLVQLPVTSFLGPL